MSDQKKKVKRDLDEQEAVVFGILLGSMKSSDYATYCLLVPQPIASDVLETLKGAKHRNFEWSICEEEVLDIEKIPTPLAHPIRSIHGELPKDKTESELLDWLVHGESFFSKKYVVLNFVDGKDGPDDGYTGRVGFEISKKEHLSFYEAAYTIYENSDDDMVYLQGCELMDRGQFLREFGTRRYYVVDDDMLESFREAAASEDVSEWAWENREMAFGP